MSQLCSNPKARFNYEIQETLDAGIVLYGFEVKSLRAKRGQMLGAFVVFENGMPYLKGLRIPPFQENNTPTWYEPERKRNLLLTHEDIARIQRKKEEAGLTVIPLSIFLKKNLVKVELAIARGKKLHDKRETIKKRDMERDVGRTLKN